MNCVCVKLKLCNSIFVSFTDFAVECNKVEIYTYTQERSKLWLHRVLNNHNTTKIPHKPLRRHLSSVNNQKKNIRKPAIIQTYKKEKHSCRASKVCERTVIFVTYGQTVFFCCVARLKIKVDFYCHLWFHEEPSASMEPFHWTINSL